ncbi:pyridoxamine 5'-phosphate oxidase family protein [Eubacteriales bacterium OttesenSCG-928-N14]|nr:pyridoxamine 5'-phosphate oxidase family protein [Eubacteriales bacterium OttesenSCG-928-N14]
MAADLKLLDRTLSRAETMILSTCADGFVTARPVAPIHADLRIYFRTSASSRKAQQIAANRNVAITLGDAFQLEGIAYSLGAPQDAANAAVMEIYLDKYDNAFGEADEYLSEDDIFIAIDIRTVRQWVYEDGIPVRYEVSEV